MKRLKLLKPWHLPTVRLKLDASLTEPCLAQTACAGIPGGVRSLDFGDAGCGARLGVTATRPWEQQKRLLAPRGNGIFAGTAIPHTGCPHQSI